MKNNRIIILIILLIAFIIFNVFAFVIPSNFNTSFWISYSFSVILFIILLMIILLNNKMPQIKKGTFSYSIFFYTSIYAVGQFILFLITKFIIMPVWLVLILNFVILGIYLSLFLSVNFVSNNSNNLKTLVNKKRFYIKNLQVEVELLADKESDKNVKEKLNKLAEKIGFSDPMSNEMLEEIENKLKETIEKMKNSDKKDKFIEEANELLNERNKKVGLMKWE